MKRVYLCCAVALGISWPFSDGRAQGQSPGFAIAGIEAKLFYSNSGRFSANILGNPNVELHNTVIGEGAGVEGPSASTLLLVKIQGPPKRGLEGLRLRMTATTEEDTLADRDIDVGTMNTAGNLISMRPAGSTTPGASPFR